MKWRRGVTLIWRTGTTLLWNQGVNLTGFSTLTFCSGDSTILSSSDSFGNQWYKNGTIISGANGIVLNVANSGIYIDTVTNNSGCYTVSSIITIVSNPLPSKPIISWNGAQFSTSATGVNYQWLLNNSPVSAATNSTYKPNQIGSYKVQVADSNGCKNVSDSFSLVVTAVNNPNTTPVSHIAKLFPNPATTQIKVQFEGIPVTNVTIQLVNSNGQVIRQTNTHNQTTDIPLNELISGFYFLKVIGNEYNQIHQFIILK